jgi:hypothetical protein
LRSFPFCCRRVHVCGVVVLVVDDG